MHKEQATELVENLIDAAYACGYNDATGERFNRRAKDARRKQKDFRKRIIDTLCTTTTISQTAGTVSGTMVGAAIDHLG